MSNFDERRDTANICVGESEGEFSRLRFEVSNTLELNWVFVYFEDGDRWSPNEGSTADYRPHRGMGRGDQEFDLPGNGRVIKRIEFRVNLIGFDTSAGYVKVYGLKEVNSSKNSIDSVIYRPRVLYDLEEGLSQSSPRVHTVWVNNAQNRSAKVIQT